MEHLTIFEKVGIGGIALGILYFGYLSLKLFITQWKNSTEAQNKSTEALHRNTLSFEKLSAVFEKQAEREIEFQRDVTQTLHVNTKVLNSTHRKVAELQNGHGLNTPGKRTPMFTDGTKSPYTGKSIMHELFVAVAYASTGNRVMTSGI